MNLLARSLRLTSAFILLAIGCELPAPMGTDAGPGSVDAADAGSPLTVRGFFSVTAPTFETGIELWDTRLDDPAGLFVGSCDIHASVPSASIDIETSASAFSDQLRRITADLGDASRFSATIGRNTYYSREDCVLSVAIASSGSAALSTVGACTLTASDGSMVEADVELSLSGCRATE